jgi:hypothetical protein
MKIALPFLFSLLLGVTLAQNDEEPWLEDIDSINKIYSDGLHSLTLPLDPNESNYLWGQIMFRTILPIEEIASSYTRLAHTDHGRQPMVCAACLDIYQMPLTIYSANIISNSPRLLVREPQRPLQTSSQTLGPNSMPTSVYPQEHAIQM